MKLREYQAKSLFAARGIAIPRGKIACTPIEAGTVAAELGAEIVLKPQLGVKGRGKVGGIAFAADPAAAQAEAERLFAMTIKGEPVHTLLVEEKLTIDQELYLAVTVDYAARCPVMIASREGGVEIELTAAAHPERIYRVPVDILTGCEAAGLARIATDLGGDTAAVLAELYGIFRDYDAELVEINPLVRTRAGTLAAADAVLNVDEGSLFRHEEFAQFRQEIPAADPVAAAAAHNRWTYIDLEGDIGILSSGAGLTMAILDLIGAAGGRAANFLDTAQIDDDGIYDAFALLAQARPVRVLLVNIFAGLNRCDRLAEGIRRYLTQHPAQTPVIVRMIGNREEQGHQILREIGIEPFTGLEEAVDRAVALAQGESA